MSLSQEEKMNLLEKRVKRLEEKQKVGLMLFYPNEDMWIPAQCDENGRMVIDPTDLDTRYLKLAGGTMTGDLDMNLNDIKFDANCSLKAYAGGSLFLQKYGGGAYANLYAGTLRAYGSHQSAMYTALGNAHFYLASYDLATRHVYFQCWDTARRTVIDLYNGKVLMPYLPTSDPGVTDELWNDGGTIKIA